MSFPGWSGGRNDGELVIQSVGLRVANGSAGDHGGSADSGAQDGCASGAVGVLAWAAVDLSVVAADSTLASRRWRVGEGNARSSDCSWCCGGGAGRIVRLGTMGAADAGGGRGVAAGHGRRRILAAAALSARVRGGRAAVLGNAGAARCIGGRARVPRRGGSGDIWALASGGATAGRTGRG